jgi:hypothetical protein
MREEEKLYKVLVGNTKERNHSQDRGVDGIKMDFREIGWGCKVGSCQYGDETWGSGATELRQYSKVVGMF